MLDEFSAYDVWQQVKNNQEYSCYFKEYSEKAYPNRGYMFNVLFYTPIWKQRNVPILTF